MTSFVLTAIGLDRPGLTEALAEAVLGAEGSWLESHLSLLGGLYVGSILVEVETHRVEALRAAVLAIDPKALEVRIAPALRRNVSAGHAARLSVVGQDRPGIVRQVTVRLRELQVNIEEFVSWVSSEPHSGASLFHISAALRLPPGFELGQLQAGLEAISAEIMADVSLAPAEAR